MNLAELFAVLTAEEKRTLAAKVDANLVYLFQIAGGDRNPSPKLAQRLAAADSRLTLEALRPDVWGVSPERAA